MMCRCELFSTNLIKLLEVAEKDRGGGSSGSSAAT